MSYLSAPHPVGNDGDDAGEDMLIFSYFVMVLKFKALVRTCIFSSHFHRRIVGLAPRFFLYLAKINADSG